MSKRTKKPQEPVKSVNVFQCPNCEGSPEFDGANPFIEHITTVHKLRGLTSRIAVDFWCKPLAFECRPGLTMDRQIQFTELTQPDGVTKYWKAEQAIGSLFGSEVEGSCKSFGVTKEIAVANLQKELSKLYESLWA